MMTPGKIRQLLDARGLRPKRSMGQSFLTNRRVVDRLMEVAGFGPWDHVAEIGTGPGHVTRELALRAGQVVGIELDEGLAKLSREMVGNLTNARIVCDDGVYFARHLSEDRSWIVFSNLPYPSVQKLLVSVFASPPRVTAAVLMVQSEVYAKLAAPPGDRAYGPLSVVAQATGRLTRLMHVSGAAFLPRARVTSMVFRWDRREPHRSRAVMEEAMRALRTIFRRRKKRAERELVKLKPDALLSAALPR